MGDLYSIPGITDPEVQNLKRAGYTTIEALWDKLAEDRKGSLEELATAAGISKDRLSSLLATDLAQNKNAVEGSFVRRHWADFSLAALAGLLLWALLIWSAPGRPKPGNSVWIRLPLKQVPAGPSRKTPYRATLVISPHTVGEAIVEEVTVTEVHPGQPPEATVAIPKEQLPRVGRLLGTADVYLLEEGN